MKIKKSRSLKSISYRLIADIIIDFIRKHRRTRQRRRFPTKRAGAPSIFQVPPKQAQEIKKEEDVKAAEQKIMEAKAIMFAKKVQKSIEDKPAAVAAIEAGAPLIIEEEALPSRGFAPAPILSTSEQELAAGVGRSSTKATVKEIRPYNTPYIDKKGNQVRKVLEANAAIILKDRQNNFKETFINNSDQKDLFKLYKENQPILAPRLENRAIGPTVSKKSFINEMMKHTPVEKAVFNLLELGNTKPTRKDINNALKSGFESLKQEGEGADESLVEVGPLNNFEIEQLMSSYVKRGFASVYAVDQIKGMPPGGHGAQPHFSIIANTMPIKRPREVAPAVGHWVSILVGPHVEYYDPLGQPPKADMLRALKRLLKRAGVPAKSQFKVNKVQDQAIDTDTCGWHAMNFLKDRYAGKPFKEASGFNALGEKNIKLMKQHWKTFGRI